MSREIVWIPKVGEEVEVAIDGVPPWKKGTVLGHYIVLVDGSWYKLEDMRELPQPVCKILSITDAHKIDRKDFARSYSISLPMVTVSVEITVPYWSHRDILSVTYNYNPQCISVVDSEVTHYLTPELWSTVLAMIEMDMKASGITSVPLDWTKLKGG